jgi:hypothetical protein
MKTPSPWLTFVALLELLRFDVMNAIGGFKRLSADLKPHPTCSRSAPAVEVVTICNAVTLATCLYCKPVLCLQRSVVAVRLMRRHGIHARLVIGYRPVPFMAHAWVEVDDRVVNDSPDFANTLQRLFTV